MAINIWLDKELIDEDKLVFDVDAFMLAYSFTYDAFTVKVLREVEHAEYYNTELFKDRFGGCLYADCLSTSTKILLALKDYPELYINCTELGDNAVDYLLQLRNCNAVFLRSDFVFNDSTESELYCNGVRCSDTYDLNNKINTQ